MQQMLVMLKMTWRGHFQDWHEDEPNQKDPKPNPEPLTDKLKGHEKNSIIFKNGDDLRYDIYVEIDGYQI